MPLSTYKAKKLLCPFMRYMGVLKGYVRNRYRPEGSIINGYATGDVIKYCTDLQGVTNIGVPRSRHEGRLIGHVKKDSRKHIVMHSKRRIIGVDNVVDEEEYDHFDELPPFSIGITSLNDDLMTPLTYDEIMIKDYGYHKFRTLEAHRPPSSALASPNFFNNSAFSAFKTAISPFQIDSSKPVGQVFEAVNAMFTPVVYKATS
ncbi:hypothetical protein LXL04_013984 [Taraxacum kok-saghyz]